MNLNRISFTERNTPICARLESFDWKIVHCLTKSVVQMLRCALWWSLVKGILFTEQSPKERALRCLSSRREWENALLYFAYFDPINSCHDTKEAGLLGLKREERRLLWLPTLLPSFLPFNQIDFLIIGYYLRMRLAKIEEIWLVKEMIVSCVVGAIIVEYHIFSLKM